MDLKEYIARFSGTAPGTEDDEHGLDRSSPVELGKAPPCEAFASLRPIADLLEGVKKYHACTQPTHVKDVFFILQPSIAEPVAISPKPY